MLNKKTLLRVISAFLLVLPFTVSAQYSQPEGTGLPVGDIVSILTNIMYWLLILLGIFGVIGFVVSGIMYLTATGDDDRMESAKKAMTWSIIGVIVGLMGFIIIQAVDKMLGGNSSLF